MKLTRLNFPEFPLRLREECSQTQIWDAIRRKWLVLTPEEWVRQHLIRYLIDQKGYQEGLLCQEYPVSVNGMSQRADIVLFDGKTLPKIVVECKAPEISITQAVFDQVARYNLTLRAPYILVTNGLSHYCRHIDFESGQITPLSEIPAFDSL